MLNGNLYYVDNSTIDIVNKFNIDRLTQFNTLMIQLSGKDSDKIKKDKILTTELKKYLDKTDIQKINELLKKNILQQTEDNIINYIILSLPIV
jgi:FAD synthase